MMIYLFIILLAILCLYLIHDIGKYFKIRKTDIKGSRIELYYIFCLTSIILSSISKLILNIIFYFLVVWYIADTFLQINMLY